MTSSTGATSGTASAAASKSGNSKLSAARSAKNDEFYTRIEDVEVELLHYREHFRGKTVYLNCDDPRWSAFWRYFCLQFDTLGLERLIATHYTGVVDPGAPSFMIDVVRGRDVTDPQLIDPETVGVQRALVGDGDFRSEECIELLKQSDIVVTNPPFSLFREYVAQLVEYGKQFVILGNMNAITYKEVWPLVQQGKLWFGPSISSGDRPFGVPDAYPLEAAGCWIDDDGQKWIRVKGVRWFTNLDHSRRHEELPLWKRYTSEEYPTYDNYDAINVNKVKDIPQDYDGAIGVPITFLDKWNPEQFEILGITEANASGNSGGLWAGADTGRHAFVDGKRVYARVFVKRKV